MFGRARTVAQIIFLAAVVVWVSIGPYYYKQTAQGRNQGAHQESHNVTEAEKADERIARYNLWLAVFTGLLVVVSSIQIYFLTRADNTARRAANTAENALTQLERPYIFIWGFQGFIPSDSYGTSDAPQTHYPHAEFIYSVSNRGKLAALIDTVSIACGYENQKGLPPPLRTIGDHYFSQTPLLSAGSDVPDIPHRVIWSELDTTTYVAMIFHKHMPTFRDGLIFRVVVAYRGPFTRGHETSQCWRYVRSVNAFTEVTDPNLTYTR